MNRIEIWNDLRQHVIEIQRKHLSQTHHSDVESTRLRRQTDDFVTAVHAGLELCRRYADAADADPGFAKIAKRFDSALKRFGVEEIRPTVVEPGVTAVSQTRFSPDCPEGTVLDIVREGLRQGDRILREAQVVSSRTQP